MPFPSLPHRGVGHTKFSRQFRRSNAARRSPNAFDHLPCEMIASAVLCLLCRAGPAAIIRTVRTAIVDTVEGHAFWRFTHVIKEVLKRAPSLANGDTSPAILVVPSMRGRPASAVHTFPSPVRFGPRRVLCLGVTMNRIAHTASLPVSAPYIKTIRLQDAA
jgi:hypothetical protein